MSDRFQVHLKRAFGSIILFILCDNVRLVLFFKCNTCNLRVVGKLQRHLCVKVFENSVSTHQTYHASTGTFSVKFIGCLRIKKIVIIVRLLAVFKIQCHIF